MDCNIIGEAVDTVRTLVLVSTVISILVAVHVHFNPTRILQVTKIRNQLDELHGAGQPPASD